MNAHDFSFTSIDGKPMPLKGFKGNPVLVVNTASKCGLTPQYAGLEELQKSYAPRGLIVIGVPSNDFGAQEPGAESEIKTFCERNYGVSFPLTKKEKVIGAGRHPFYAWAAQALGEDHAPKWNFHKYLIGADGEMAEVFGSRTEPKEIRAAIEARLAKG